MSTKKKGRSRRSALLPPTRWAGLEVLDSTRRLNARCFGLLAEVARTEHARIACGGVFGFQELWAQVDPQACERAGACPVLLLNLHFDSSERWKRIADGILSRPVRGTTLFPVASAAPLLREILTEARIIARSDSSAARFLFGMVPAVCTAIGALSAADIERIAVEHAGEFRPRWEGIPSFWSRLLEAAISSDLGAFAKIHVHCIQLLGTGLVAPSG
jgi:hypothetical protein